MDEPNEKSIKSKLLPLLLILPAFILLFFFQYPENFGKFFGFKNDAQKTAPVEIQPIQAENIIIKNEELQKKTEENQENAKASTDTNENDSASKETAEEPAPKEEIPRPDLTIGIVADAHVGQSHGFSHLNSAVWVLKNQVQPDIVVDLGDLIESRNSNGYISKKEAEADYRKAKSILSAYPLYHVIGNHELLSMSKDNVANLTGRKNRYNVNVKGYQIIVLDANYTNEEDHIDAKNDDTFIYTGNLTSGALDWFESRLKESSKNIIFIHHPLWNLENKNEVSRILKKYKDKIIFAANGHKHPITLGVVDFGSVKNYNIPSVYHQRMIAIAQINGSVAKISIKKY